MNQPVILGDVARIDARIVDPTHPHFKDLPHVSAENIAPVTGDLLNVRSAVEDGMQSGKYLFEAGDVLYSKLRPYLQKAAVVNFAGLCSADMYPLKADRSRLLPDYLRALLVSAGFTAYANEASARSRMPKLNREQLFAYEFTLPPIETQRAAVSRVKTTLAEVDRARQAAQAQLRDVALLQRRLLQAAFDQLGCEPRTLGCVLNEIQTGKSFLTAEVLARPDELGVLKVSAVSWSQFRADQAKALKGEYAPAENHRVKQGDLLISRANTRELVGAVVLVERDHPMRLLSDKTLRLVVDESRANKDYLLLALRADLAREHIELYATGTSDSMRNISQDVIASIPILLPPLADQRHIVARLKSQLDEADTMAQAATAQLAEINRLPQRLLAQAFNNVEARP